MYFYKRVFQILLTVILFSSFFSAPKQLAAQKISGQEFWFTLPRLNPLPGGQEGLFLYIVSDYCIDEAFIEAPHLGYREEFTVDRGSYTEILVPTTFNGNPVYHNVSGNVENKGFFIKTEFPAIVYLATYTSASVDGEIIVPLDMLGEEYVISNRGTLVTGALRNTVVATEDETEVEIETWDNAGNPVLLEVLLDQGETYQWSISRGNCVEDEPRNWYADCANLNGSVVNATKPISIMGSLDCSGGFECGACENTAITFLPLEDWGDEFVTAQITPRANPALGASCGAQDGISGDYLDVVGPVGTTVTVVDRSGTRNLTIDPPPYDNGANYGYGYVFFEVEPETGLGAQDFGFANTYITADNPIQVTQWPKGWQTDNQGSSDPEALMVYSTDTWENSYIFAILNTATTLNNDFVVVVENVGNPAPIDNFEYDDGNGNVQNINNVAGATNWIRIANTDYYYKRVPTILAVNTLRIYSRTGQKFGIYMSSRGQAESYMQNGGDGPILEIPTCPICPVADFDKIEDVCIGQNAQFTDLSYDDDETNTTQIVEWAWNYGDGTSETFTSSTNPTHVYSTPGVYDVTLSVTNDNQNPGPCTIEITKQIIVFDGPSANAGPDQEICAGDAVAIGGTPTGSGGEGALTYSWTPGTGLSSASDPNPNANPSTTETYEVQVEDEAGCSRTDEVLVTVFPKDSAYIADDEYTICNGDQVPVNIAVDGGNSTTYTVIISNGNSNTTRADLPSNGGVVNVPVNPNQPNGFNVSIISFQANDPDICGVFNVASVPVIVRAIPDPSFRENALSICEGDQFSVLIDFLGSGPYSFDITDGSGNVASRSNISDNPYEYVATPTASTTYTISNVRYSNDPACPSAVTDQVDVTVLQNPNPGDDAQTSICSETGDLDLFPLLGPNADMGGTWTDLDGSGALSGSIFQDDLASDGEYRFRYSVRSAPECPAISAVVTVDYNEPPRFRMLEEECSSQLEDFQVTFQAFGGDPDSYSSNEGTFAPGAATRNFTSTANYPSPSGYNISFDDQNGCGPVVIDGFKNCGCFTNAGTMSSDLLELCETDSAFPVFNNDSLLVKRTGEPDDTLYFVLHEGNGRSIVNPIDSFATPAFAYFAGLTYGVTYYLSPVAGEPTASGGVDYDPQGCISIGQGTPIKFFQQPTIVTNPIDPDICFGEDARLQVSFTGASPFVAHLSDLVDGNTSTFSDLNQQDTLVLTTDTTNTFFVDSIGDRYCANVPVNVMELFVVHYAPDSIPGTLSYTCTPDGEFYSVSVQLSGDAASMRVSPSSAGTIDPNTGIFTSNTMPSNQGYTFTFTDDFNCGSFVLSETKYSCPCLSDAGTFSNTSESICSGDSVFFTHNQDHFFDANDDSLFIISTNQNDMLGSVVLEKKVPAFGIQAPLAPDVQYYFSMVVGNRDGSGGVDYLNDTCVNVSPPVPLLFFSLPTAVYDALDTRISQCLGTEFKFPYTVSGAAPFTIDFNVDSTGTDIPNTYTFNLSPRDTLRFTPNEDAELYVTRITDNNGCSIPLTDSLTANVLPSPEMALLNTADTTVCEGEFIDLIFDIDFNQNYSFGIYDDATGEELLFFNGQTSSPFTYTRFRPTGDIRIVPGNLSDAVCTGLSQGGKQVFVTQNPTATLDTPADICEGDVAIINVSVQGGIPPYDLQITGSGGFDSTYFGLNQNDQIGIPGIFTGTNSYSVNLISDASPIAACEGGGNTIQYAVNPLPDANLIDAGDVCAGDEIPLTIEFSGSGNDFSVEVFDQFANQNDFFNLENGSNIVNLPPAPDGERTVNYSLGTVTDELGCTNTGVGGETSIQYDKPIINFDFNNTNDACNPVNLTVDPDIVTPANSTCTWTFEDGTVITGCVNNFNATFTQAGDIDMHVNVTTEQGCFADTLFPDTIHVRPLPIANFNYNPTQPTSVLNIVDFANTSVGGDIFQWNIDTLATVFETSPQFEFPVTPYEEYWVQLIVSTEFNCLDSTARVIEIAPELVFYIPNSFTPNEDGTNDEFKPVLTVAEELLESYVIRVFNRWGESLFVSSDINEGWDGTYAGRPVRPGVYTYSISARILGSSQTIEQQGAITIAR